MSKLNEYFKTIVYILIIFYIGPCLITEIQHQWTNSLEPYNKIGYIYIHGTIEQSGYYRKNLTNYFKDPSIKAILLHIESNGGAIGSCQALAFDIENLKKEYAKPIVTYTENICTSGAYEIAAATDHIIATGAAIIGNIGTHISDDQKIISQALIDNTNLQLSKEIAHKRHLQMNKIDQWGCGKIFTGQQAYDLKLVDALGSKTTAVTLIKKNIIPSDRKIEWVTPQKNIFFIIPWKNRYDEYEYFDGNKKSIIESFFTTISDSLKNY